MNDRDDLAALLLHGHPLVSARMADELAATVAAAGWVPPQRLAEIERLGAAGIAAEARAVEELEAECDALAATMQREQAGSDIPQELVQKARDAVLATRPPITIAACEETARTVLAAVAEWAHQDVRNVREYGEFGTPFYNGAAHLAARIARKIGRRP